MSFSNIIIEVNTFFCGCSLNILWSPLKKKIPKKFAFVINGHPVSKVLAKTLLLAKKHLVPTSGTIRLSIMYCYVNISLLCISRQGIMVIYQSIC